MFPLGDDNTDRVRWPIVTVGLVVLNVALFLLELQLEAGSPEALVAFIQRWGVIPHEYSVGRDLPPTIPAPYWVTLVTSMFLHGGWGHLIGNMLYLWIFGDNVEDRLGRIPFVLFYLGTGIIGALAQIVAMPDAQVPTIGASGAISGVLGAYIVMFPHKRVRVIAFVFFLEVPAVVVLGLWALTQFAEGFGSLGPQTAEGGVAYLAHVGGFVSGMLGAGIWRIVSRRGSQPRVTGYGGRRF